VPSKRIDTRIGPLLHALIAHGGEGQSDGQLLARFLTERDEGAFATIVHRHGGMVLGVCRRVLGNAADAEDAFQATFVVLVRKAPSLTSRLVVGDWLHGVAKRTALNARAAAARRRQMEPALARPEAQGEEVRNDWLPRLDEELSRLPEKYRLPIVLCDLEGKTRQQAARLLGWPEGTVAGRLVRARALLAKRLLRGAQILSGVVPATMAGSAAKAALPLALVHSTILAASSINAGNGAVQGVLSTEVMKLAKGVIQSMFWTKIKIAAITLSAAVVLAGVGGRTVQMLVVTANEQPALQEVVKPRQAKDQKLVDDLAAALALARQTEEGKNAARERAAELVEAAKVQWEARMKEYIAGKVTIDFVWPWSVHLLRAELRLLEKKADMLVAYQAHIVNMKELEQIAKGRFVAGNAKGTDYYQVVYARIEAEIWLDEARTPNSSPAEKKATTGSERPLVNSAKERFEGLWKNLVAGDINVDQVLVASTELLRFELYSLKNKADIAAAHQVNVNRLEALYKIAKAKNDAGQMTDDGLLRVANALFEAKIRLTAAREDKW
jgi:RNA polymerase sigma factor (sigma-70 family)